MTTLGPAAVAALADPAAGSTHPAMSGKPPSEPVRPIDRAGAATLREGASTAARRAMLGALLVGVVALPLVFTVAVADVFALPKTLAMVAISIPLAVGLGLDLRHGRLVSRGPGVVDLLVVYALLVTAATIRSVDPAHSLVGERLQYQGLLATLCYAIAFLAARRWLVDARSLWLAVAAALAAVAVVATYGLLQEAGRDPIWHVLDRGRIFSTLGQANALGAYLVLALPLALAALVAGSTRSRILVAPIGLAVVAALGLTLSRGAFLGAAVAVIAFVALTGGTGMIRRLASIGRRGLAAALVALAVLAIAIVALPPLGRSVDRVVARVAQTVPWESSAESHLDLWAVGIRIASDHPLLGIGPEQYPTYFPLYRDEVLPPARADILAMYRPESPHDVPIAIADGAGLPALATYLALIAACLLIGLHGLRGAQGARRILLAGIVAAVLGHLVTDLFMTPEVSGSWLFWLLLGALAASATGRATAAERLR